MKNNKVMNRYKILSYMVLLSTQIYSQIVIPDVGPGSGYAFFKDGNYFDYLKNTSRAVAYFDVTLLGDEESATGFFIPTENPDYQCFITAGHAVIPYNRTTISEESIILNNMGLQYKVEPSVTLSNYTSDEVDIGEELENVNAFILASERRTDAQGRLYDYALLGIPKTHLVGIRYYQNPLEYGIPLAPTNAQDFRYGHHMIHHTDGYPQMITNLHGQNAVVSSDAQGTIQTYTWSKKFAEGASGAPIVDDEGKAYAIHVEGSLVTKRSTGYPISLLAPAIQNYCSAKNKHLDVSVGSYVENKSYASVSSLTPSGFIQGLYSGIGQQCSDPHSVEASVTSDKCPYFDFYSYSVQISGNFKNRTESTIPKNISGMAQKITLSSFSFDSTRSNDYQLYLDTGYVYSPSSSRINERVQNNVQIKNLDSNVELAPNPIVKGEDFYVVLGDEINSDVLIAIYSFNSELQKELKINKFNVKEGKIAISTLGLKTGIYIINIKLGDKLVKKKLVIK